MHQNTSIIVKEEGTPASNPSFLLTALSENIRLDGRKFNEHRQFKIAYGRRWGSCIVSVGETKVLTDVSSSIENPKTSRSSEGRVSVDVKDLSETLELIDESIVDQRNLPRIIEKYIRETKYVDLESLCIVSGKYVWEIKLDLKVLCDDGNLVSCCSMAALAGLVHFKHPDVTFKENNLIIHKEGERDLIPLTLHHYPIIVSYALYNDGKIVLKDPNIMEESESHDSIDLTVNTYKELCGVTFRNGVKVKYDVILHCTRTAFDVAENFVHKLKELVEQDQKKRLQGRQFGYPSLILENPLDYLRDKIKITLRPISKMEEKYHENVTVVKKIEEIALISESDDEQDIVMIKPKINDLKIIELDREIFKRSGDKKIDSSEDSEEEKWITLDSMDLQ